MGAASVYFLFFSWDLSDVWQWVLNFRCDEQLAQYIGPGSIIIEPSLGAQCIGPWKNHEYLWFFIVPFGN